MNLRANTTLFIEVSSVYINFTDKHIYIDIDIISYYNVIYMFIISRKKPSFLITIYIKYIKYNNIYYMS